MVQAESNPARAGIAATEFEAVPFRFSVTWSSLSIPIDAPRGPRRSHAAAPSATSAVARVHSELVPSEIKPAQPGAFQWEMVVPKMVRPNKKGSLAAGKTAGVPAAPRSLPAPPAPDATAAPAAPESEISATGGRSVLNLYTASVPLRRWFVFKLCLGLLAVAAVLIPVLRRVSHPPPKQIETTVDGGDWIREAAVLGDPGVKQERQLVLYRPSLKAGDGRLEFDWTPDEKGVGWVFRAKDLGNYYAMRLKLLKPGPSPALGVEYFTVYNWTEGSHSEKVLILSSASPVLRVRMDIFGPVFTLYLQGSASEYWNDARLLSGAVGFFEEASQTADVRSVRMSFPERSSAWPGFRAREFFSVVGIRPSRPSGGD